MLRSLSIDETYAGYIADGQRLNPRSRSFDYVAHQMAVQTLKQGSRIHALFQQIFGVELSLQRTGPLLSFTLRVPRIDVLPIICRIYQKNV